ncbi:hypothetical protein N9Q80_00010 [Saprospiraceae bacterium]|nr:hypothetical protein [Saprospiraceae bacterium]
MKIEIIDKKDKKLTTLKINNKVIEIIDVYKAISRNYSVGKGYKSRYWKGQVGYLKAYNLNKSNAKETILTKTK